MGISSAPCIAISPQAPSLVYKWRHLRTRPTTQPAGVCERCTTRTRTVHFTPTTPRNMPQRTTPKTGSTAPHMPTCIAPVSTNTCFSVSLHAHSLVLWPRSDRRIGSPGRQSTGRKVACLPVDLALPALVACSLAPCGAAQHAAALRHYSQPCRGPHSTRVCNAHNTYNFLPIFNANDR